jgi:RAT1-interacting protein
MLDPQSNQQVRTNRMGLKRPAEDDPSPTGKVAKARIESDHALAFPSLSHPASHPPAFQRPSQLLTFSYSPSRVLQFDDSALRYFVNPPHGADLNYGYENWTRRPEERGRIDGLLSAWSRFKKSLNGQNPEIGVISWRGVITKENIDGTLRRARCLGAQRDVHRRYYVLRGASIRCKT